MANINVDADYSKYQSGVLTNLQPSVIQSLPSVNTTVKAPEKIIVQAHQDNAGAVIVGQGTTLPEDGSQGGYVLLPGQMQILSGRDVSVWKAAGSGAGGQGLIVTYLSGAN